MKRRASDRTDELKSGLLAAMPGLRCISLGCGGMRVPGAKFAGRCASCHDAHSKKNLCSHCGMKRGNGNCLCRRLREKYDLTLSQYVAMEAMQGGLCAICNKPPRHGAPRTGEVKLVVDHDHATGEVRGLLCTTCNLGLGAFCDSEENLLNAVLYLHTHKKGAGDGD